MWAIDTIVEDSNRLTCDICQQTISGKYVVNAWQDVLCTSHLYEGEPFCDYCNRPFTGKSVGGGKRFSDNTSVCAICLETAVVDQVTAQAAFKDVTDFLNSHDIYLDKTPIELKLRDRYHVGNKNALGLALIKVLNVNGKKVKQPTNKIRMRSGMPYMLFGSVLIHELGHTWLAQKRFPWVTPKTEEGICELFAYLWLNSKRTPYAGYLAKKRVSARDDLYGGGLRKALQYLRNNTLLSLLDQVKLAGDFAEVERE